MAAEIGTMRVTEQIDALEALSTNPYSYLVAPRLIAGHADDAGAGRWWATLVGVMGGYIVGVHKAGLQLRRLSAADLGRVGDRGRGQRPGQGGGLWLHRHA